MDDTGFLAWLDAYEGAWRSPGTDALRRIFSADAVYLKSPYAEPVVGLDAIAAMWDEERDGPDEFFTMSREVVAVSGDVGVGRVEVTYGDPARQHYRDLWVVRFDDAGLAVHFEEWPFWPDHGIAPPRPDPAVLDAEDVDAAPWREVLRSGSLSAGVYALAAGTVDGQRPHDQDEVYVVLAGAAELEADGRRHPVREGSVAFVPARAEHRFVDITEDLRTAVVFAPPETPGG
jgi:mannose-6-phosphate isomerase-like protein (cupin superfamily)